VSTHLRAKDIARELGFSRSEAYEIMREMPAPTAEGFAAWHEAHTDHSYLVREQIAEMDRSLARAQRVHAMTVRALRYIEATVPLGALPPPRGFVYFGRRNPRRGYNIQCGIKAGFTLNPVARFEKHAEDGELEPLLIIPGSYALESHIHRTLARWRIPQFSREWFEPCEQVRLFIRWLSQFDKGVTA
jgi:hypothetical protein